MILFLFFLIWYFCLSSCHSKWHYKYYILFKISCGISNSQFIGNEYQLKIISLDCHVNPRWMTLPHTDMFLRICSRPLCKTLWERYSPLSTDAWWNNALGQGPISSPIFLVSYPFPSYDNSTADDIKHILLKNRKSL